MDASPAQVTYLEHVRELRRRLVWTVLTLIGGGLVGYRLSDHIQAALIKPLGQKLYYSSPTGGFEFMFRLCVFFGLLIALPVVVYHLLKFFEPVIKQSSRRFIAGALAISVGLAIIGLGFAYFITLPAALKFLAKFGSSDIQALISTSEYFSFVMIYLFGFALLFQLPLLLLLINRSTPLPPSKLMKYQRLVILVSFVVAAIVTPTPDPLNQTFMAGPIIGLYQISIFGVWLTNRHRQPVVVPTGQISSGQFSFRSVSPSRFEETRVG